MDYAKEYDRIVEQSNDQQIQLEQLQAENAALREELTQQAAVIDQLRETTLAYHSPDHPLYKQVLTLQPCPGVLNKVRADAVREVINSIKGHACSEITRKALDFADLIEKGEA